MDNPHKLIKRLQDSVSLENFEDVQYEVVEDIGEYDDIFSFVEPIIKLMENNPDADFGAPGALVHFVEKYYKKGYEEILLNSLKRRPTVHTIWMLHRIINDKSCPKRNEYINFLRDMAHRDSVEANVRELILSYPEFHD